MQMKKLIVLLTIVFSVSTLCARDWKTESGYRGNVETGFVFGGGDWGKTQWIVQTTHGYQVIPSYLFVGGGVGLGVFTDQKNLRFSTQLFGDVRSHFPLKSKFSPFVDVKMGFEWNRNNNTDKRTNPYEIQDGFYFSPSVGVNYALNEKFGLDLSIGYTLNTVPTYYWSNGVQKNRQFKDIGGFTLRLGFDF